jgi:hypothetical protein
MASGPTTLQWGPLRKGGVQALTSAVSVERLGEGEYGAWARLVAESPDGSIYSLPEYLDVLCRCTGARFRIVAAPERPVVAVIGDGGRRALAPTTLHRLKRRVRGA